MNQLFCGACGHYDNANVLQLWLASRTSIRKAVNPKVAVDPVWLRLGCLWLSTEMSSSESADLPVKVHCLGVEIFRL